MLVDKRMLGYKKSSEEEIVRQKFARHNDELKSGDEAEVMLKTKIHHDAYSRFMTPENRIDDVGKPEFDIPSWRKSIDPQNVSRPKELSKTDVEQQSKKKPTKKKKPIKWEDW